MIAAAALLVVASAAAAAAQAPVFLCAAPCTGDRNATATCACRAVAALQRHFFDADRWDEPLWINANGGQRSAWLVVS